MDNLPHYPTTQDMILNRIIPLVVTLEIPASPFSFQLSPITHNKYDSEDALKISNNNVITL
jgi:hypothetical protein